MKKTDASLIEKELAASLKLIESGLNHLDIEAAHLLNPKINSRLDSQYSSKSSKPSKSSKSNELFNDAARNVYLTSKLDEALQSDTKKIKINDLQLLHPPDLKFSFYSSKEYIIPSAQLESVKEPLKPLAPSIIKSGIESGCSDKKEQLFPKFILESKKITSNSTSDKIESAGSVIEMHDITESLLKIRSALDNLDREAEYLLNPIEFNLSHSSTKKDEFTTSSINFQPNA
ncbi:uncharacterized protein LOC117182017 [Belonocnema kinseyi]|uniref:uncharacterized protein LOC117182017 n=1 Tax=Belonocnema kinseyi TaxID=2817044 RepID=UPI00143E0C9B|nr:uncharacterized protein LOC117182017 [Belonocnema kinseyi]